jgi:flagella basal body P-ring formation protein FlgA
VTNTLSRKSNRFIALNDAPSLTKKDLEQLSVVDKNEVIKAIREGDDFKSTISLRSINDGLNALRSTRI